MTAFREELAAAKKPFKRVKTALRNPIVVDLRNIYRPGDVAAKGLTYVSVGRG